MGRRFVPTSRSERPGYLSTGVIGAATDWQTALSGCGAVVHLMARVHRAGETGPDLEAAYRTDNVEATLALARQAVAAGAGRFVFLSSAKVQGDASPKGRPFIEADAPQPGDPYARSKLAAEQGLREIEAATGMAVTIIRAPLVYGPGVRANFHALLRLAELALPLPFGRVANRRSLIGVGNLSDVLIRCVDAPAAAGETFLVADGEDLSTTDLLRWLARELGKPSLLLPFPTDWLRGAMEMVGRGDLATRLLGDFQLDSGKVRSAIDWQPPFSVEAGLRETVAAYRAAGASSLPAR